ncbi:MAG TPA: hypothetical protein VMU75_08645 [Acidimicrobiales bacterium]|nr:hypothetical protein [Acidimicrobiales bacterium]
MTTGTAVQKHYVTLKQLLAERPWLTERWLRRGVAMRTIPFSRAGGKLLFALEDLDGMVEANRVEPS